MVISTNKFLNKYIKQKQKLKIQISNGENNGDKNQLFARPIPAIFITLTKIMNLLECK